MKIYGPEVAEGTEFTNLVAETGTAFPTVSPDAAELFYRTDQTTLYVYSGTGWDALGNSYNIVDNSDATFLTVDVNEDSVFTGEVTALRLIAHGVGGITTNTAVGLSSLSNPAATGAQNTAVGEQTLAVLTTGWGNVAIGRRTLDSLTIGSSNSGLGYSSLPSLTEGINNTGVGGATGSNITTGDLNTFVGYGAGKGISTGNYNTIIGALDVVYANGLSSNIIIANGSTGSGSIKAQHDGTDWTLTSNSTTIGTMVFDTDQVIGAGQDNMVLTYDNALGAIQLEAAAAGGLANIVEDTTPQLGAMLDVNTFGIGDGTLELLSFSETASAVNEFTIANAATAGAPVLSATGDDANIGITLTPKGTGNVKLGTMTLDSDQAIGAGQDNYVLTYDNALGTVQLEAAGLQDNLTATTDPASTDGALDGYVVGSMWVNVTADKSYICVDATSTVQVVLTGSIDPTASTTVVGVGTLFTTELVVGQSILVSAETRVVDTITDNLNLTVTAAFTDVANDATPEKTEDNAVWNQVDEVIAPGDTHYIGQGTPTTTPVATGTDSLAMGDGAEATTQFSVAIGYLADAKGDYALSMGHSAFAKERYTISVGYNSQAGQTDTATTEQYAIAYGPWAKAYENGGVSIGAWTDTGKTGATADPYGTAVGYTAKATANSATAIGTSSKAYGDHSFAGGSSSTANEHYAIAIGYLSESGQTANAATEAYAIAIGTSAKAYEIDGISIGRNAVTGKDGTSVDSQAIAIGRGAIAREQDSIAVGYLTRGYATRGVALGMQAYAYEQAGIAIGYVSQAGQTAGAGTEANAIAIGQNAKSYENSCVAIGSSCTAGVSGGTADPNSIAIGGLVISSGLSSVSIGYASDARANSAIAIGDLAQSLELNNVAIGYSSIAGQTIDGSLETNAVAIGPSATAYERQGTAIGFGARAGKSTTSIDPYATAIGSNTIASAEYSTALGYLSNSRGSGSIAIGRDNDAFESNCIAIGSYSQAGQTVGAVVEYNCVSIGSGSKSYNLGGVALGSNAIAGTNTTSVEYYATAVGYGAIASKIESVGLGLFAFSKANYAISIGSNSEAMENDCISIGHNSQAGTTSAGATEINAIAIGTDTFAYKANSIAIGYQARANYAENIVIGAPNAQTQAKGEIKLQVANRKVSRKIIIQQDMTSATLDVMTDSPIMTVNRAVKFTVDVVGLQASSGDACAYKFEGIMRRTSGGGSAMLVTPVKTTFHEDDATWDADVVVNVTSSALEVKFKGDNVNTVYVLAEINIIEIGP